MGPKESNSVAVHDMSRAADYAWSSRSGGASAGGRRERLQYRLGGNQKHAPRMDPSRLRWPADFGPPPHFVCHSFSRPMPFAHALIHVSFRPRVPVGAVMSFESSLTLSHFSAAIFSAVVYGAEFGNPLSVPYGYGIPPPRVRPSTRSSFGSIAVP